MGCREEEQSYLLVSRAEAAKEAADWRGGLNLSSVARAENRAYGWLVSPDTTTTHTHSTPS